MFPPNALRHIVTLTNIRLGKESFDEMDIGELIRFFGTLPMMTRHEFGNRRDLWNLDSLSKCIPPPAFGRFGMSRNRFDETWCCIRFSCQPDERPTDMPHEDYRWILVEDFVRMFNSHREANFNPSLCVCVDESMVCWYGNCGHWINIGLPMCVEMDRKPKNGCEIHSACCGESGIMLRLKLRKTGRAMAREECAKEDKDLNEGTKVLKELVMPWAKTDRLAVADSYFASVMTAEACCKIGLQFIGVVKTATRKFPHQCLQACELEERGSFKASFHHKTHESDPDTMAFIWMDRDRRCFVSTCSNLRDADPIIRTRWRQVSPVEDNEDPVPVTLSVPVPNCAQLYYDNCGKIDQHNRIRQAGLCIEKKAGTKDWSK